MRFVIAPVRTGCGGLSTPEVHTSGCHGTCVVHVTRASVSVDVVDVKARVLALCAKDSGPAGNYLAELQAKRVQQHRPG